MKVNSYTLPIHPVPDIGDSIGFYLVKLSALTGWMSAKDLLAATGLVNHKYFSPDSNRLIQHLNQITGHDEELLFSSCFPEHEMGVTITNNYYPYRNFVINIPRLCPACLQNDKSMKAIWQYLPNTYCHEHKQKLLSACPNCQHQFDWDAELLSYGCSHCGTPWSAMVVTEADIPDYLHHFNQITDSNKKLDYLNDLLLAAQRSIRPYDSILEKPKERLPEYVRDWHSVLQRAYNMLTDEAFYQSWLNFCKGARREVSALGGKAIIHPIITLKEQLKLTWPLHRYNETDATVKTDSLILPSFHSSSRSRRLSHQKKALSDTDLRYQIKTQELAKLLGCRLLDIRIMIDNNVLQSINNTDNTQYAIFDIRNLVNGLKKVNPNRQSEYIRFNDVIMVTPLFSIEYGDILTALLSNKLQAFTDPHANSLRDGLYVSRYSLMRQFRNALSASPELEITRTNVPKILGITDIDLKALAKEEILQPFPCGRNNGCYRKKDLIDLISAYFLLSRWAKIRNMKPHTVRKVLSKHNIEPILGKNLYHPEVKSVIVHLTQRL